MWKVRAHADAVLKDFLEWRTMTVMSPTTCITAASDSSSKCGGHIAWTADRQIVMIEAIPWRNDAMAAATVTMHTV